MQELIVREQQTALTSKGGTGITLAVYMDKNTSKGKHNTLWWWYVKT